ncbi:hypothetical protein GCM10020358_67840 [Amorphoplanes nipponensis]|uniref:DUF4194 domain-containing protein n=1 Tax=Actinoplanes nipponensis TaxID=135950 RepID=A0A919JL04_9ACTN|nr:DUF4194 domain-containing protein [Actinoplanes nipponensis]GIE51593.1 hypothetical protein Ani05nite_51270 [Actinoplanes nipponensis]
MTIDDTANTQSLVSDDPDAPDRELSSSVALFEGDEGALEIPQRRALVALLKNRFITARSHPKEWHTLIADPRLIRSRLNDQFMDLHLDLTREVAYKRQAVPEGGGRFPTLLHDTAWSREETILLVYLRSRARSEEAAGTSRTLVDRQDLLEHVASLRPEHATDQAGDARRTANAIENLNRAGLLVGASAAEQFEVSPAVDVVLPLEKLQELLRWLQSQNSDPGTGVDPADLTAYAGDTDISDEDAR